MHLACWHFTHTHAVSCADYSLEHINVNEIKYICAKTYTHTHTRAHIMADLHIMAKGACEFALWRLLLLLLCSSSRREIEQKPGRRGGRGTVCVSVGLTCYLQSGVATACHSQFVFRLTPVDPSVAFAPRIYDLCNGKAAATLWSGCNVASSVVGRVGQIVRDQVCPGRNDEVLTTTRGQLSATQKWVKRRTVVMSVRRHRQKKPCNYQSWNVTQAYLQKEQSTGRQQHPMRAGQYLQRHAVLVPLHGWLRRAVRLAVERGRLVSRHRRVDRILDDARHVGGCAGDETERGFWSLNWKT